MKKNTLKKVFSALSLTAVAASAVSLSAFGAGINYAGEGDAAAATITPTLTVTKTVVGKEMAGQNVTVNIDVAGANGKYCNTGIRLYYSDRLTIAKKANGREDIAAGDAITDLGIKTNKIDDSVPAGSGFNSWFFTTGGEGDFGTDGTMWSITFTLPADAEEGEVFPLDIVYQAAGKVVDCFFDKDRTTDGVNMEAYLFTNGIKCATNPTFAANAADIAACPALADIDNTYDGYIAIAGAPETTTTTVATTTTTAATTTTTVATSTAATTAASTAATTGGSATTTKAGTTTKKPAGTTAKPGTTTKAATTTAKKDSSPKTGVAGVGVAAAGLAVAIGTAFVLRKKED